MSAVLKSVNKLLGSIGNKSNDTDESKSSPRDIKEIETDINYANNTGSRYVIDMEKNKYDVSMQNVKTKVTNGRKVGCMFGSHGFQLIEQNTTLTRKDFYTNNHEMIQKVYYKEIEQAIKKLTGAEAVVCMHHMIRNSGGKDKAPDYAKVDIGPAAHAAHCDYTGYNANNAFKGAIDMMKNKKDNINYNQGRFAVINVWRNINDEVPIHDNHLAVCDGRTVIAPDDFMKYDYKTKIYASESYYLSAEHHQLHKWYYFPRMEKNEALVFMQYDSDWKSPARYGFHTAIKDPTVQKMKNVPPRESIEARLVAFFPNFEPNTIPQIGMGVKQEDLTDEQIIEKAVKGIQAAITVPEMWPTDARKHTAQYVATKSVKDVIKMLVEGSKTGGHHGLGGASKEIINKVIEKLMEDKDNFDKTMKKNFPLNPKDDSGDDSKENEAVSNDDEVIKKAVEGVKGSITAAAAGYWPETAKQEFSKKLKDSSIEEVVGWLVYGAKVGGHHGLKDASDEVLKKVIAEILKDGDKFKEEAMKNFPLKE